MTKYLNSEDETRYQFLLTKRRNKQRLTSKEVWELELLRDLESQIIHDSPEYKKLANKMDKNLQLIIKASSK